MVNILSLMLINAFVFAVILVVLLVVLMSKNNDGEDVNGEFYKIKENVNNEDKVPTQRQSLTDAKHSL